MKKETKVTLKTIVHFEVVFPKLWKGVLTIIMYPLVESSSTEAQHGLLKHESCTTQLLYMYHMIGSVLDASGQVAVVYLDFHLLV